VAFTTPEESYKPTVIFFGLTNSLATFQAIINDILRDLVDTNSIANFKEIAINPERNASRKVEFLGVVC